MEVLESFKASINEMGGSYGVEIVQTGGKQNCSIEQGVNNLAGRKPELKF